MVRIPLLTFKVVKIDDEQIVVYIFETIDFKKGSRIDPVYHNKTTSKIKFLKWNNVSLLSESSWIQNIALIIMQGDCFDDNAGYLFILKCIRQGLRE